MKYAAILLCVYKNDRPEFFLESLNSIPAKIGEEWDLNIYLGIDGPISDELQRTIDLMWKRFFKVKKSVENQGLSQTLNSLISCLENESLVFRMDADDVCINDRFCRQINYMEKNAHIGICGTAINEMLNGKIVFTRYYPEFSSRSNNTIYKGTPLAHPTVCFRRDTLILLDKYSNRYPLNEDIELWFRALSIDVKIGNIREVCLQFRLTHDFYKRRSFTKAINEFKVYWGGVNKLYGFSWKNLFVLARLSSRFLPRSLVKLLYKSNFRKGIMLS